MSVRIQFLRNRLRKAGAFMPEIHRFGRAGVPILVLPPRRGSMPGPGDYVGACYDAGPENQRAGE